MDDGRRITIPHQGDASESGGETGDLIIVIHVRNDRYFERNENDLYCAVPISFSQAILGADITITTLDNRKATIKIPACTSNGKMLRIKNEGVPYSGGTRKGDLYVKIIVQLPSHVSKQQAQLLQEYLKLENPTDSPSPIALSELSN